MEKKDKKKRFQRLGQNRTMLMVLAVLAGITIVINLLRAAGLTLIHGEYYLLLPLAILAVAVGWGVFTLIRLIRNKAVRVIVGVAAALALFILVMVGTTYLNVVISLTVPQRYATVSTQDGAHRLVVMRVMDSDESRIEARRQARLSANPDGDPEEAMEDLGYVYTAYAPAAGVFYRPDTLVEGEVYIGYASKATLMIDWEEDAAVGHFYVRDPEPGDGGEMRVRSAG